MSSGSFAGKVAVITGGGSGIGRALGRALEAAGGAVLAGTDASSEPRVFAGAGLHDELALLVQAGLTPTEALGTATLNPLI